MADDLDKKTTGGGEYFGTDHLRTGLRARALKGATFTVISQAVTFGIHTVGAIVLARILSPGDFGLLTMVLTVALLLGNFGVNGITEAVIKTDEINHEQISTLFWINICCSIGLASLFVGCSPAVVWFYQEPRLASIIWAIAAANVINALSVLHLAILKRNMAFHKTAANDVVAAAASNLIPIALAVKGWGYWALVAKWVLLPFLTAVGAWCMCGWRPGRPARGTGIRPMVTYALHTYGNFMVSYLRRNLDKILIGRFFGSQPLGFYDRAYHLSGIIPTQLITPLNSVAVSTFSRLSTDPQRYTESFFRLLSLLAFVGMPLGAALALVSRDVVHLLLGAKWNDVVPIFLALALSIGVSIIYSTHGWLHLSLGTPDRWFRWSIVEFVVTAICFMVGLPFGALGVAVGFSASFYILVGPAFWYAGRPVGLKPSAVFSAVWRYYFSALAAAGICWYFLFLCGSTSPQFLKLGIAVRIFSSVALCTTVYLVLTVAVFGSTRPLLQFISMVREIIEQRASPRSCGSPE